MPRVLLLMATTSYRALAFLDAARRLGVETAVGSDHRQVLAELAPGRALEVTFGDPDAGARQVVAFAKRHPVDAILAAEDDGAVVAAKAAAELALPHNPVTAVEAARYKHRMRDCLAQAGIPTPGFQILSAHDEPAEIARRVRFPCVLKPVFLAASRGVIRANDPSEFQRAFERVLRLLRQPDVAERGGAMARLILVEDYVPGTEVALEGLLTEGSLRALAIFDKPEPLEGPFFEETIYVTPSRLPAAVQEEVVACTTETTKALGLRTGPVHAELRLNDAGLWILEVAPRSIGGLCSRVLRFDGGVSLEELILRHALGMDVAGLERERLAAGVMMIPIPGRGVLREVRGLPEAGQVPGVEDVIVSIPLGQPVVPLPEGDRYLGFIFARGEAPEDVEAALRQAHGRLTFIIEDGGAERGAAP
ncbi:MAG: ATP-grasp domain-containing protein [Gemmatimonadetes bacterium]|nr:ATP-grasp domain-containing protein [Gemmatimonadota bacterium]